MAEKLTEKEKYWAEKYLIDLNGTKAAMRVYETEDPATAANIASENLRKPKVQKYLDILREKRARRTKISQDEVIYDLKTIKNSNMKEYFDEGGQIKKISELPPHLAACIQEYKETEKNGKITRKIKLYDKVRAEELLGRHMAMFIEKKDISVDLKLSDLFDENNEG